MIIIEESTDSILENTVSDVEDNTGDEIEPIENFSISSYGADYPVELISNRVGKKDWYTPPFQRNFVWSLPQASRFIESLLLGLPVPGIFLFKELDTGKHLIIDGQQRTKSIQLYVNGDEFRGKIFRLTKVASQYDGKSFNELDDEDQLRLMDAIIHATIFHQDFPEDDNRSIYEIFERINTGGTKLSAQEIRSCVCHGKIVEFLEDLSKYSAWKSILRSTNLRLKDHELILRFFAFLYNLKSYSNPMKKFLDDYMAEVKNLEKQKRDTMEIQFCKTIEYIYNQIGSQAFRPVRTFNAAVFDAISVETAKLLGENGGIEDYKSRYRKLITDTKFLELTSRSTADIDRVQSRFKLANIVLSRE